MYSSEVKTKTSETRISSSHVLITFTGCQVIFSIGAAVRWSPVGGRNFCAFRAKVRFLRALLTQLVVCLLHRLLFAFDASAWYGQRFVLAILDLPVENILASGTDACKATILTKRPYKYPNTVRIWKQAAVRRTTWEENCLWGKTWNIPLREILGKLNLK